MNTYFGHLKWNATNKVGNFIFINQKLFIRPKLYLDK